MSGLGDLGPAEMDVEDEEATVKTLPIVITLLASLAAGPSLAQNNNANPAAPGQDRTSLVTTGVPHSWNDVDLVGTKSLPRKAAEAQAKKDPTTMRTFEYANDALVLNHTSASAEELCNEHFAK